MAQPPRTATQVTTTPPPLVLSHLTLQAAGRPLACLPHLTLNRGEVLHLLGPNGAGKTTLLRVLAGELPATGRAEVLGHPPGSLGARAATAWVPTHAPLPDDLTAKESLHFTAALWRRPVQPLLTLAAALGLTRWLGAWPTELSQGTRQKVALSGALGLGLPLTLLDEPFGTLDSATRQVTREAIQTAARAGSAFIITTHGDELATMDVQTLSLDSA
nr:ATP-binding cassette domain-containing protein [Deinococcus betulae]